MSSQLDQLFAPVNDDGRETTLDRVFQVDEEPNNVEAEVQLLCSLMFRNDGFDQVADLLTPDHFYDGALGRVYGAISALIVRGDKANPVTLKRVIPDHTDVVAQIAGCDIISVMNNVEYARIIINMWQRREMIRIGRIMAEDASSGDMLDDPHGIREDAEGALFALASGTQTENGAMSLGDFSRSSLQDISEGIDAARRGEVTGVPSGLTKLDELLSGFKPAQLIVLAGRPSMGKTALALSLSYNAARDQTKRKTGAVAFFSLEMSKGELIERLFSSVSDLDYTYINKRALNDPDYGRLVKAEDTLRTVPLYVDDRAAATIARVRTECRKIARKSGGIKLVVIDYLQLMSGGNAFRPGDRYALITELTMQLKQLAKELHVPVLVLSQLSRKVEERDDKRPQLSDLRESGSIEQDADVVMFVYREEYYLERAEPVQKANESLDKFGERYTQWQERLSIVQGTADIIIGKARGARIGSVRCAFLGHRQRFSNLERVA
ncbi:replicative DNA helicase [Thalassospira lohafexi]|uniref:Replicative DNA helicase n=1 Tax=Thalassospira lohafexi TaxID=744227 RepID=A0A2N3L3V9_9PROT|nr:replicative DNA helicase [Thalassospira lohafexi]PKR57491.1 replicative DNA helicase [Thalassospira lohafexi]